MAKLTDIISSGDYEVVGCGTWKTAKAGGIFGGQPTETQMHFQIVYLKSTNGIAVAREDHINGEWTWVLEHGI